MKKRQVKFQNLYLKITLTIQELHITSSIIMIIQFWHEKAQKRLGNMPKLLLHLHMPNICHLIYLPDWVYGKNLLHLISYLQKVLDVIHKPQHQKVLTLKNYTLLITQSTPTSNKEEIPQPTFIMIKSKLSMLFTQ